MSKNHISAEYSLCHFSSVIFFKQRPQILNHDRFYRKSALLLAGDVPYLVILFALSRYYKLRQSHQEIPSEIIIVCRRGK